MPRTRVVLRGAGWLQRGLIGFGIACLSLFAWYQYQATHYQAEYERAFEEHLSEERARPPAKSPSDTETSRLPPESEAEKAPPSPALDELLGRLEIPRLDLRVMVLKKADAAALRKGAGWIAETAPAGQPGNMGIAGHRDTHFRPLEGIRTGDTIHFTTVDGKDHEYRVDWVSIVSPSHVEVLDPTEEPAITLVTCYPFHYVGHAPKRFIVRATQIGQAPST